MDEERKNRLTGEMTADTPGEERKMPQPDTAAQHTDPPETSPAQPQGDAERPAGPARQPPAGETPARAPRKDSGGRKKADAVSCRRGGRRKPRRPGQKKKGRGTQAALRIAGIVAVVLCISSAAVVWAASGQTALQSGVQVLLNDESLGIVSDQAVIESDFTAMKEEYAQQYGLPVQCDDVLTFRQVEAPGDYFATRERLDELLRERCQVKVLAQVILVNGRQAVAVRSKDDAYTALEGVLAVFQGDGTQQRENLRFVEAISLEEHAVDIGDVLDAQQATQTLLLGEAQGKENWVEVQQGDTLEGIADTYNLTVQDLYQANPQIAGLTSLEGVEKINAIKPMSWLSVLYDVTTTTEQVVPCETVQEQTTSLYTNQTKVKQEGQDGKNIITTQATFKNGEPAVSRVLSTTVVQEAVNKIVLVGTKKVEVATGSWTLPLKAGTYTITSRFGMRTLNGVTRMHKGVDLAAAIGTKIYASRAGTVSYAGTASGYGLVVYINHAGNAQTRYGHCSKLLVKAGQKVEKGQLIALVGNTGDSTGPHCHFEVRINGTAVNPLTAK